MKLILAAMGAVIAIIIGASAAPHVNPGSYPPAPVTTTQPAAHAAGKLPPHKLPFHGLLRTLTGGQGGYGQNGGSGRQGDQGDTGN